MTSLSDCDLEIRPVGQTREARTTSSDSEIRINVPCFGAPLAGMGRRRCISFKFASTRGTQSAATRTEHALPCRVRREARLSPPAGLGPPARARGPGVTCKATMPRPGPCVDPLCKPARDSDAPPDGGCPSPCPSPARLGQPLSDSGSAHGVPAGAAGRAREPEPATPWASMRARDSDGLDARKRLGWPRCAQETRMRVWTVSAAPGRWPLQASGRCSGAGPLKFPRGADPVELSPVDAAGGSRVCRVGGERNAAGEGSGKISPGAAESSRGRTRVRQRLGSRRSAARRRPGGWTPHAVGAVGRAGAVGGVLQRAQPGSRRTTRTGPGEGVWACGGDACRRCPVRAT